MSDLYWFSDKACSSDKALQMGIGQALTCLALQACVAVVPRSPVDPVGPVYRRPCITYMERSLAVCPFNHAQAPVMKGQGEKSSYHVLTENSTTLHAASAMS